MPAVSVGSDLELSYSDQGNQSADAVVLIPGPTDSWPSYEPVLPWMPGELRVVALSLRGHGESSKPPSGYRIEDLASDIVPFLDALAIDRAVLVGHSGSCLVARRVALDAPDRVAGLMLEASPTTLDGDHDLRAFVDTAVSTMTWPLDRDWARSFIAGTSSDGLDSDFIEHVVDDLAKLPPVAWKEMFSSLLDYDDTRELSRLEVPVSLVWGDDDELVPKQMQDELVQLLPSAELSVYPGVGHTPRWEEPVRFARELTGFAAPLLG